MRITGSRAWGIVCALAVVLVAPPAAADSGLRLSGGFLFSGALPDRPQKASLGMPWYLRFEVRGLSRMDTVPTHGDRPSRGHVAVYDAFFVEAGFGAICGKNDCVTLGDVHLRGTGGYEALVGYRAPSASVYVGPRLSWEGWITSGYALGAVSWPVVLRVDHAVAETKRRVLVAWASPHGAFRSYGGQWDEPIGEGVWLTSGFSATRAAIGPPSDGALALTATLGLRVGSPF